MIHSIAIHDLVKPSASIPVLDVRTPAEFTHGHIPGASNLPLFSNEERAKVGTTYKQESREAAILLGFDLTGSKWSGFIRQALEIAPQKKVAVHCWRGGMRSGAMAWALNLYGFEVFVLAGGYKRYRRWVLQQFEAPYKLWTIGGMTGSGKTRILQQLGSMGQQVIDLEDLARHRGSAYGTMNKLVQPSQEQFENNLSHQLNQLDRDRKIWVEDESLNIGKCNIPRPLWDQMQSADLFELQTRAEQRVQALVQEYGSLDKTFLSECTDRIRKRLGSEQTKNALTAIQEDRMEDFIRIVLVYYDKTYRKGLNSRKAGRIFPVDIRTDDPTANASQMLMTAKDFSPLPTT
ncbi:tRNA 2-selenouridine(34) synthase MnmH [Flavitalea sp. BT771]|uniref:tRNA 2-selenouridine(34) synthase MnmH n=1 Tax=Flavitalea sp. BT771 TaxID=3063329 RepID=UPI0026E2CA9C|nr:tRNA 2-selenouridine(34) synthase MnmH [Flavitalea sp. BT771]MDO6434745.1 tRNA 2-selenouridine(34) synthase MnmH [Flavitalea sp. BT771]MDV6223645.1 tRNA 2-selenouridine(34) synthase MnmH [Flavitalea sp. BT771]